LTGGGGARRGSAAQLQFAGAGAAAVAAKGEEGRGQDEGTREGLISRLLVGRGDDRLDEVTGLNRREERYLFGTGGGGQ